MTRWIALLLLLMVIAAGVRNEPAGIEQRLHGKVVLALANDDLSEVRVQLDGRQVLLSGPEELVPQALEVVEQIPGVRLVDTRITAITGITSRVQSNEQTLVQVLHPTGTYWPINHETITLIESELRVTKAQRSVAINGAVSNNKIKQTILAKIEQFIDIPEHLFDVTVNKVIATPDWFSQELSLIIPFVQWVEEGQLQYQGNNIRLDGIVQNSHAWKAIETAIANMPSSIRIDNRLQIETN